MPFGKLSLKTTLYLEINFICSCGSYSKAENCLDGTKSEHPDSPETFENKKTHTLLGKFQNPFVFILSQNKNAPYNVRSHLPKNENVSLC